VRHPYLVPEATLSRAERQPSELGISRENMELLGSGPGRSADEIEKSLVSALSQRDALAENLLAFQGWLVSQPAFLRELDE
jgi:hypothetical protein